MRLKSADEADYCLFSKIKQIKFLRPAKLNKKIDLL